MVFKYVLKMQVIGFSSGVNTLKCLFYCGDGIKRSITSFHFVYSSPLITDLVTSRSSSSSGSGNSLNFTCFCFNLYSASYIFL